jgi:hypothetical protein
VELGCGGGFCSSVLTADRTLEQSPRLRGVIFAINSTDSPSKMRGLGSNLADLTLFKIMAG